MTSVRRVFFDHDGGVDDFVALALLLSQTAPMRTPTNAVGDRVIDLLGISITPADTYIEPAIESTLRYLDLTHNSHVPVAAGTIDGYTEFPHDWRLDAYKISSQPQLHQQSVPRVARVVPGTTGQELMLRTLQNAVAKVDVLLTGPFTNLAWCLEQDPSIVDKIDCVIAMAGAVDVAGNVLPQHTKPGETHDKSAEWNVYWDATAAHVVLSGRFPSLTVRIVSLDVTNQVPITAAFLHEFGAQYAYPLSALAGNAYALVSANILRTSLHYFAWDVLTALWLLRPDFFEWSPRHIRVHTAEPSYGRTEPVPNDTPNTKAVLVAKHVDPANFYRATLTAFRC
jgi:purine nucleosidase